MTSPDFEDKQQQAKRIHGARVRELNERFGLLDLLSKYADPRAIGDGILHVDFSFQGEPTVRLRPSRSKQNQELSYKETIEINYDGEDISISGREETYTGTIPREEEIREEVIGHAIEEAFANPFRTVANPRDSF